MVWEPEIEKQDLVVNVAGYNPRFVGLHKFIRNSVIAGTEYGM